MQTHDVAVGCGGGGGILGDGCNREVAVACPSLYIISVERAAAPAPRSIHGHHQIAGTEVVERGVECIVVPPCGAGQRGDSHRLERGAIGHHIVKQITRKSVGKIDGDIVIAGGSIMARAASHEAIESKGKMTITAGTVAAYSSDDAINSASDMHISGGYVYAYSTGNDAIDANGNLTISGGVVIACGALSPEEGIDAAEGKTLSFNGGTILGIGGGAEATSGSQQKATIRGISISSGSYLTVHDSNGNNIFAFKTPRAYSNATLQVSSPNFSSGTTYTLGTASSASGNDSFYGFISSATVSGETNLGTFTTSTTTSGGMGGGFPGGNGGGGGFPGRW